MSKVLSVVKISNCINDPNFSLFELKMLHDNTDYSNCKGEFTDNDDIKNFILDYINYKIIKPENFERNFKLMIHALDIMEEVCTTIHMATCILAKCLLFELNHPLTLTTDHINYLVDNCDDKVLFLITERLAIYNDEGLYTTLSFSVENIPQRTDIVDRLYQIYTDEYKPK